jgi:alpha-galactosidase
MDQLCCFSSQIGEVEVLGQAGAFKVRLRQAGSKEGVEVLRLTATAQEETIPPRLTLRWRIPQADIQGTWTPISGRNRQLRPDWSGFKATSRATFSAPVYSLYNLAGRNRMTFALSDALEASALSAGVDEETGWIVCQAEVLTETIAALKHYEVVLRIDSRDLPLQDVLGSISNWWAGMEKYRPAPVPAVASAPMYSTWYSFHEHLDADALVEQCRLAADLGCEAIIVDDGWQTRGQREGYAYCGDWQSRKMGDLAALVRRVHQTGLKFLLWYAVGFVGYKSRLWNRFKDKLLYKRDRISAGVLDPRYPEVRSFLIETYVAAMEQWDLDGFKLDFVDSFRPESDTPPGSGDGRDVASVAQAAHRLLGDCIERLRQIKPDVLIEFRQRYIGPAMRKYGNMFRAADCPGDCVTNRVQCVDIRLLSGRTPCHGDMLMWHGSETTASAALQLLSVFFAVPQISVRLNEIPPEHLEMLRFYLGFWKEHRSVLLAGRLEPTSPVGLYPAVTARDENTSITVLYDSCVARIEGPLCKRIYLINATGRSEIAVELGEAPGRCHMRALDPTGKSVAQDSALLPEGLYALPCPPSGMVVLERE